MDKSFRKPIGCALFIGVSMLFFYVYGLKVSPVPPAVIMIADVIAVLDMLFMIYIIQFVRVYDKLHPVTANNT